MLVLTTLLALAGPVASKPGVETVAYRCDGGKRLSATWEEAPRQVTITSRKHSAVLQDAVMMSSVDYFGLDEAGGPIRLNGGKTQINVLSGFPGGPYFNCQKG